jgi:hypothetical protein
MAAKLCTILLGYIVGIVSSILIMIYGWGLEPKSWLWIIGGGVFLSLLGEVLVSISKDME